jgi:RNA polymerase primary sigma factor
MEEKEGLNPGPRNAQFVNTDEESVVFLTGRDLLMRLNEKRQDPYLTELINANDNVIYRMNKRLIWSVVRKYKRLLDSNESFQNGSWGLTIALKRFDIDIGVKFSTYATWWIRQKITREEMNTSTIIRIPVHVRRRVQHFLKNKEKLMKLTGIEPTVDEVVEKYYSDVSELKIRTLKMGLATLSTLSLDRPIDSDEDSSIKMFIENSKSKIKDDIRKIENTELKRTLFELAELTPREQKVIGLRYGLKTKFGYPKRRSHTLDEVAEMYGLTRERIRQIQVLAERKLRRAAGIMKTTGEY